MPECRKRQTDRPLWGRREVLGLLRAARIASPFPEPARNQLGKSVKKSIASRGGCRTRCHVSTGSNLGRKSKRSTRQWWRAVGYPSEAIDRAIEDPNGRVAWAIVAVADPISIRAIASELEKESRLPRPPQPAVHRSYLGTDAVDLLKNLFCQSDRHFLPRNRQSLPPTSRGSAIRLPASGPVELGRTSVTQGSQSFRASR